MVNLRAIANRATSAINPNVSAIARISTGYTTAPTGIQVPFYADAAPVTIQAQALTTPEIKHLDSLNIQGATIGAYSDLQLTPVDRTTGQGGDLVQFGGAWYLVIAELEGWSLTAGWCKVALRRQTKGSST
jgi:hypothetical protein